MLYTQQQLSGGPSYTHHTRIGNWNEDVELNQIRFAEFLKKKEQGILPSQTLRKITDKHYAFSALSVLSEDGFLRFGSKIMLFNEKTKCFLSVNLSERLHFIHDRYLVTGVQLSQPVIRGCFVIERVATKNDLVLGLSESNDMLHYGQHIKLRLCDEMCSEPMYIRSELISPSCFAPKSKQQEVSIEKSNNNSAIWKVECTNPAIRFECEGTPVKAHVPLLLRHVQTNELLACPGLIVNCEFGKEFEVSASRIVDIHKVEKDDHYWSFVCTK